MWVPTVPEASQMRTDGVSGRAVPSWTLAFSPSATSARGHPAQAAEVGGRGYVSGLSRPMRPGNTCHRAGDTGQALLCSSHLWDSEAWAPVLALLRFLVTSFKGLKIHFGLSSASRTSSSQGCREEGQGTQGGSPTRPALAEPSLLAPGLLLFPL